eukprot:CAMPEP_0114258060 /NCGR_PEP_ID=MMETSP0058-20121206/19091_1 /TAXON_ID=36894 /ORGANISM="Pyramimonas parkeae, CCMP726" /LENGTH=100 /DNA_ID=CAMNT_0001372881 /DNA_START=71 /DNA_END=370 /DNA_ORIENTATION=+
MVPASYSDLCFETPKILLIECANTTLYGNGAKTGPWPTTYGKTPSKDLHNPMSTTSGAAKLQHHKPLEYASTTVLKISTLHVFFPGTACRPDTTLSLCNC